MVSPLGSLASICWEYADPSAVLSSAGDVSNPGASLVGTATVMVIAADTLSVPSLTVTSKVTTPGPSPGVPLMVPVPSV